MRVLSDKAKDIRLELPEINGELVNIILAGVDDIQLGRKPLRIKSINGLSYFYKKRPA